MTDTTLVLNVSPTETARYEMPPTSMPYSGMSPTSGLFIIAAVTR